MNNLNDHIKQLEYRLVKLEGEKLALQEKIRQAYIALETISTKAKPKTKQLFSPDDKIRIFMNLFKGRTDVFPKRWDNKKTQKSGYSPACFNEWVRGICNKPVIKCSECPNQSFIPLTDDIIKKHLGGEEVMGQKRDFVIGLYPMLENDTCWLLAVDFDKENWQKDTFAFIQTCRKKQIPFALERSRSGNGAHVWIFFECSIAASQARKLGATLITAMMEDYPEIGFESYDRFFPNQDTLPSGGFGNLIALPLQRFPREKGNSIFLDDNLEPYEDQWQFLASLTKMSEVAVNTIVEEAANNGKILGVRMPIEDDSEKKPWEITPSRKAKEIPIGQNLPKSVNIVLSNQIFIT